MIIAIHQPNFLPWPGYFYKMLHCDIFVLLDDAQYTKNSFINRNRIKTSQGEHWMTIPVSPKLGTAIRDVQIKDLTWPAKLSKTLMTNYGRAKYFDELFEPLSQAFNSSPGNLCGTNTNLIHLIARWLDLPCRIVNASDYPTDTISDERLVTLVTRLGGDAYLSGYGGRNYQSVETFQRERIVCRYYDFQPPVYQQLWEGFIPGLSIIDCLFSCGKEGTAELLRKTGSKRTQGE